MKRKIIVSLIMFALSVSLFCSLFFDTKLEIFFKLQRDMKGLNNDSFAVHFIDVGQGDAIAIRFPNNKTMLIDSGPAYALKDLKEYLDRVFFKDDYNTFDYVFLTHSDVDHSGNMNYILENYNVNNFYRPYIFSSNFEESYSGFKVDNATYDTILTTIDDLEIPNYLATNGAILDVGCATIEIFTYANLDELDEPNDFSPTIIVTCNENKVCFSGDAGEVVEKDLINREVIEDVDLLKLSHHGSKYSNSLEYINQLQPEFVVCSVGENSFGHPASDTLLRLAEYDKINGKNTYKTLKTTLDDGNVIYYVNKDKTMSVVSIANVGDYLYARWYFIVVVGEILMIVGICFVIIPKKRIIINRHMKNMKA